MNTLSCENCNGGEFYLVTDEEKIYGECKDCLDRVAICLYKDALIVGQF